MIRKYERNESDGDGGSTTIYRVEVRREGSDFVETLNNVDDVFQGKLNSATVYANLLEGEWYQFKVRGIRNETWSMFPNIEQVSKVSKPKADQDNVFDDLNTTPPIKGEVE